MTYRILTPDSESVQRLQGAEWRYYFSGAIESVLRQFGHLPGDTDRQVAVITRQIDHIPNCRALVEGPIAKPLAMSLGFEMEARTSSKVTVLPVQTLDTFKNVPKEIILAYPQFTVRRVPDENNEYGEIELSQPSDPLLQKTDILYQRFVRVPDGYTVLLEFEDGGAAAVTDGRSIYLSFPLFDLLCADLNYPELDRGYYASLNALDTIGARGLLTALLQTIGAHPDLPLWPHAKRAAMTIRHDYDRLITDRSLRDLLSFYDKHRVKCTWYTLIRRAPVHQLRMLKDAGHEIALHTEATTFDEFASEIDKLRELDIHVCGISAHGGGGSFGFVGDLQYRWAEQCGLVYGEILGRNVFWPGRIIHTRDGWPRRGALVAVAVHVSLETTTKDQGADPGAVDLAQSRLKAGGHLNLMNHPDLCREDLYRVIEALDLTDVWLATHSEVAGWINETRYAGPCAL